MESKVDIKKFVTLMFKDGYGSHLEISTKAVHPIKVRKNMDSTFAYGKALNRSTVLGKPEVPDDIKPITVSTDFVDTVVLVIKEITSVCQKLRVKTSNSPAGAWTVAFSTNSAKTTWREEDEGILLMTLSAQSLSLNLDSNVELKVNSSTGVELINETVKLQDVSDYIIL